MGNELATDPKVLKQSPVLKNGDYDERPVHQVRMTHDFYMSETEVTAKQYSEFREDYQDWSTSSPYATGVSWYDCDAFCQWLSKKENKHYRLPTEAEWEYASRAGSEGHFFTGSQPPAPEQPNPWGLKNMNAGAAEWVLDWYGRYPENPQIDPVGPAEGLARGIRGGGLNGPYLGESTKYPNSANLPFFRRSANRASIAPVFRGRHNIGFRIVEAPLPRTKPLEPEKPFTNLLVKQTNEYLQAGPDPGKPWFRQRDALPIPPEGASEEEIEASGLPSGILGKNHNPALVVCPNGDLLALYFTASVPDFEDLSNVAVMGARLRFGSDEWDMPDVFLDFADTKDIAPAVWAEGSKIYFFWGGGGLDDVPFRWTHSVDNGASWSAVQFPLLDGARGGYFAQPVSRGFRGPGGILYMPTDGVGGESLLWASTDDGRTWSDTLGRTAGRHTVFVVRNTAVRLEVE